MPKITIDQNLAAIGIETTPAKMNISLPRLMMKIKSEAAQMEIDSKSPSFKINRKKLNADMGLRSTVDLSKAYRDRGKSAALRAVGEASSKGDVLANVRQRGNRVAQLSRQRTLRAATSKKGNIGLLPKSRPEIVWDPGYMKIHWSRYNISIDWEGEVLPQVTIDPKHSIEVFLREKPYFRIMVEEGADPYAPGRQIDELL